MKLIVTGGAGFIGSNFIRMILTSARPYKVLNYDKLTYAGNPENLRDVERRSGYDFIKADICDTARVRRTVSSFKPDAIINFAAETHVDRSILGAADFVKTDVFGTHALLEAVKEFKVPRYIQISTDEVYGSTEKGSFTETSSLVPNSPYAASKAAGDLLCRSYFVTYGLPAIVTRSSNNYGPCQYPEKVIPLFITNALEGSSLPLYGDGKNVRDWIYVEDNCRAVELVLRRGRPGEIYNIGGGSEVENRFLAREILELLDKPASLIKKVCDRPGHDRRYSLNSSKIKKLGFSPSTDFGDGLRKTVEWYRDNPVWWKKLKNADFKSYCRRQYGSRRKGGAAKL
ncbi:MAG: dTDP-glucose 4,6-dehydratase [Endomicrobiia bacterium]|nr:dTDP-glucose 4,6-dehydratase [Endomicrobiia bacterium]